MITVVYSNDCKLDMSRQLCNHYPGIPNVLVPNGAAVVPILLDWKVLMISLSVVYVPVANPTTPNVAVTRFLVHMNILVFSPGAEYVTSSMIGGTMRANELLANAPTNEISRSKWGTTMATPAEKVKRYIRTCSNKRNARNIKFNHKFILPWNILWVCKVFESTTKLCDYRTMPCL